MPAKQVQAVQVGSDSFPILTVQLTEPGTGTALGGTPSEESDIKRPAAFRRHASIGALKVDITFFTPGVLRLLMADFSNSLL